MQLEEFGIIEKDLGRWKKIFLEEKQLSLSKESIKNYNYRLDKFIEYSYLERVVNEEELSIKSINRYFVLGFISYLKEEKKMSLHLP